MASCEKSETLADIVSDIRERADNAMRHGGESTTHNDGVAMLLRSIADRLEEAWKMEEAQWLCVAHNHVKRTVASSIGHATALREALVAIDGYLPHFLQYMRLHWEDANAGGYFEKIKGVIKSALATPPRNCDVGTFEEQRKRFKVFCRDRQYGLCDGCPVVRSGFCTLQWAQMPYGEGGAE